jgi:hypothetical protein
MWETRMETTEEIDAQEAQEEYANQRNLCLLPHIQPDKYPHWNGQHDQVSQNRQTRSRYAEDTLVDARRTLREQFGVPVGLDGRALEQHDEEDGNHLGDVESADDPHGRQDAILLPSESEEEEQHGLLDDGKDRVVYCADDVYPEEALCRVECCGHVPVVYADI